MVDDVTYWFTSAIPTDPHSCYMFYISKPSEIVQVLTTFFDRNTYSFSTSHITILTDASLYTFFITVKWKANLTAVLGSAGWVGAVF